jgi:quercetin dioxygenase-like cupin family protein
VGASIRKRRRDMGLTLAQVGERSGFTTGYLSQLERDLATPSLLALAGISRALGVELDYFLGTPHARGHHFPHSTREFFSIGRQGMRYAGISGEFPGHSLNAMMVKVPAHYASPEPMALQGEEFVFLVQGRLRYTMGDRQFDLRPGDAVHLPSSIPHRWQNPSDQEASVLWVGTAQIFRPGSETRSHQVADTGRPEPTSAPRRTRAIR